MKVLNLIRRLSPESWGGVEESCINMNRAHAKNGVESYIYSTQALAKNDYDCIEGIEIKRFSYFYPYFNASNSTKSHWDFKGGNPLSLDLFKTAINDEFDIIHIHTLGFISLLGFLISRIRNVPYIVSIHGGYADVPEKEKNNFHSLYKKTLNVGFLLNFIFGQDLILKHASKIICYSYKEYEKLSCEFGKRVIYLPNGVFVDDFEKQENATFRLDEKLEEKQYLLSVGRVDPQKNQMHLINEYKILQKEYPNFELLIVGSVNDEEYYNELKKILRDHNLRGVKFICNLGKDKAKLAELYKNAFAFVHTPIHEPFGIVYLEAMCSKTPVVTNLMEGSKNWLKNEKNSLVFNDGQGELLKKIDLLIKNPTLYDSLVNEAYKEIKTKYCWQRISKRIINEYSRALL